MKNLKNEVMETLKDMAEMNNCTLEKTIIEVLDNGCSTGIVPSMIYYTDTYKFFDTYKDEINEMAQELSVDIYGDKYSIYKNMNMECNKNTMAWFGFEEMTRQIATDLEIEY